MNAENYNDSYKSKINLHELDVLEKGLSERGIKFERYSFLGGDQIYVFNDKGEYFFDAICNRYSLGHQKGLLEIMGSIVKNEDVREVEGYLSAEEILRRIDNE